ncbi:hypothetical protein WN55_11256 [Dufourea novaeangliae]|uniref:Uncharacterized protein n=1 Tax=Dufourea novaeangliae TaxID=178035 RepID=A0A154P9U1_DUFNO|nr:hypothetical protein WN55_11256 [Dufourea novaeangliae]
MYSTSNNCMEHPLGILCKCVEYQDEIDKFTFYSIGTRHHLLPKINIEPIASAKVLWINNHMKVDEDISIPVLEYSQEKLNINARNIDKIWIPASLDVISLKSTKVSWKLW